MNLEYSNEKFGQKQFLNTFKKFFLLQFTKELIKHSAPKEIIKLKKILHDKDSRLKDEVKEKIKELQGKTSKIDKDFEEWRSSILDKKLPPLTKGKLPPHLMVPPQPPIRQFKPLPTTRIIPNMPPRLNTSSRTLFQNLNIPEPTFPNRFQYLRPYPTNVQIDLVKLNPLIQDPLVKVIECHGPDKNLIVKGKMGIKKATITLTKEDIEEVLQTFSEVTKIPLGEGIYRVAVGNLIFAAIISEVVDSKFIIRKMEPKIPTAPVYSYNTPPRPQNYVGRF